MDASCAGYLVCWSSYLPDVLFAGHLACRTSLSAGHLCLHGHCWHVPAWHPVLVDYRVPYSRHIPNVSCFGLNQLFCFCVASPSLTAVLRDLRHVLWWEQLRSLIGLAHTTDSMWWQRYGLCVVSSEAFVCLVGKVSIQWTQVPCALVLRPADCKIDYYL